MYYMQHVVAEGNACHSLTSISLIMSLLEHFWTKVMINTVCLCKYILHWFLSVDCLKCQFISNQD